MSLFNKLAYDAKITKWLVTIIQIFSKYSATTYVLKDRRLTSQINCRNTALAHWREKILFSEPQLTRQEYR